MEEENKKLFEIVEMMAQNQQELIRLQEEKPNHRRDLIYKFLIPTFLVLLSLWLSGELWKTAKLILTG